MPSPIASPEAAAPAVRRVFDRAVPTKQGNATASLPPAASGSGARGRYGDELAALAAPVSLAAPVWSLRSSARERLVLRSASGLAASVASGAAQGASSPTYLQQA